MYITSITIIRPNEIFQDRWDLCIYLNPELHYCDAMHTHTTLSLVHNVREERTKKKEQIEIIFFLSIQKRDDLSTSCIQDYLSVTSYALRTDHEWWIFSEKILRFFLFESVTWISLNTKWPLRSCRTFTFNRCNFEWCVFLRCISLL